jgi:prepilin-type N-terminal cleavage/methylation domain-containing protein
MKFRPQNFYAKHSGFTMVEVAISLAIIGIALVAIIGVLPLGMNVQKDNREETLIGQDATVFMEAIRNGTRGANDLTNYVYAITNFRTFYNPNLGATTPIGTTNLTGTNIIGLLSTPEYTDLNNAPIANLLAFNGNYNSNHVVAYVYSISGPAVEKPPQDNGLVRDESFSYKMIVDNLPVAVAPDAFNSPNLIDQSYARNLTANLHEVRLAFLWPLLPNGNVGYGRQTFRTLVAGQLAPDFYNTNLYFYQPQIFTNNAP